MIAVMGVVPSAAQNVPTADPVGIRVGAVFINPAFDITNIGLDTNILRESEQPKRDEVATMAAHLDLATGRNGVRLATASTLSADFFQTYSSQNALNHYHQVRVAVTGRRTALFGSAQYVDARERYNYEIDSRVQRNMIAAGAGVEFRLSAKTTIVADARHSETTFDDLPGGVSLNGVLHQRVDRATTEWRWRVTPLTSVVAAVDASRARFEESPVRNADRLRILPGVEFDTRAAISGRVLVGYQRFDPRVAVFPSLRGVVASIDVTVPMGPATRLKLLGGRDLEYSYEVGQPVYVVRAFGSSLIQRAGRWEFEAGGSHQQLSYRTLAGERAPTSRVDTGVTYRGHVRYQITRQVRTSLNGEFTRRDSLIEQRRSEALRVGAALEIRFVS
jgi:hypothetical protein